MIHRLNARAAEATELDACKLITLRTRTVVFGVWLVVFLQMVSSFALKWFLNGVTSSFYSHTQQR